MMTEMEDVMVLEHRIALRSREKEAASKNGVFENSVVDSPASGVMEVTEKVVGMETLPPALTHSALGDGVSKHGDGAQTESAEDQELALPTEPSEGGRVIEPPFESSSLGSGNVNGIAGKGKAVAQKNPRTRGENWSKSETGDLLEAVRETPKGRNPTVEGTDSVPYWDAVAKAMKGSTKKECRRRTGHECRGRMDGLKRSFSTIMRYCGGHRKEFEELNDKDFVQMKVSPRLTEAWYNQIRDHCPPKKKSKTNGAGTSSKTTGFAAGFVPPVPRNGIEQGEPSSVDPPGGQLELPVAGPRALPTTSSSGTPGRLADDDSMEEPLWNFDYWYNAEHPMP